MRYCSFLSTLVLWAACFSEVALAGPPAPCGYYYDTLTPRPCAGGHPYANPTPPPQPTVRCRDGAYSFAQDRNSACLDHGGVEERL